MANRFTYVPYRETGYFSPLVVDYLENNEFLRPFYQFTADEQGLAESIGRRSEYPVDRELLVSVLEQQYANLTKSPKVAENIARLRETNTFTVCTAHQPNLFTGYLYFIYKIAHAIRLADELSARYPDKHFVPVFYMGSEDNDLEELGTFRFRGERFAWDGGGQHGAVGRMNTASLRPLLKKLSGLFGPPGDRCTELAEMLQNAYGGHQTVGAATQYLVNELFGQYGLVVIDPDDAKLKSAFAKVMEDELLHQRSYGIIKKQCELLAAQYKIQAHPREINLFYLNTQQRDRIEKKGDHWEVLNSGIRWDEAGIYAELKDHPERLSPNVMLRGLFQEMILPDVAFIGGGAEVAYWLQLRTLFEDYQVFYPAIFLRQSAVWVREGQKKLMNDLGLTIGELFLPEAALHKRYVLHNSSDSLSLEAEIKLLNEAMQQLKTRATAIDATLERAAEAAMKKINDQVETLEKKMLRAEKRKMATHVDRISRLRMALFPGNSLQERVENFMEYYLDYGPGFIDVIVEGTRPYNTAFLAVG